MFDLDEFSLEDAKPYIGETFKIHFGDGNVVDLTLERVDPLLEKHISPNMKRDAFAMTFRGPKEYVLKQHIYALYTTRHEEPLQLFLVPLRVEPAGTVYEAIFN